MSKRSRQSADRQPEPTRSLVPRVWAFVTLHALMLAAQVVVLMYPYPVADHSGHGGALASGLGPTTGPGELERLLALPDAALDKVDVARLNLLVAKDVVPDLDVERCVAVIDDLAAGLQQAVGLDHPRNGDVPFVEQRLRAMAKYLHGTKSLRYVDYAGSNKANALYKDPGNLFLSGVIERMKGTCVSMPVLYLALGERLGWPLKAVNAGDHVFCRWDDGAVVTNIEPTEGGGWSPDEDYIRDMGVTPEQIKSGAYMRTLPKREVIGNFFLARAAYYEHGRKDIDKAIRDLQKAVEFNPRDVDAHACLARLHAKKASDLGKDVAPGLPVPLRDEFQALLESEIRRTASATQTRGSSGSPGMPPNVRPAAPPGAHIFVPDPATYGIRR